MRRNSPCFVRWASPVLLAAPLLAQQPPPPAPAPDPAQGERLQWKFGETTVKLGGYVKLDLIHDFDAIGSAESFDPRTIPTDGSSGINTLMQARESRVNLDVRGPSSGDMLHVFVEGDFFGANNSFRLRKAYGEMGGLLAGQTWTNFQDEDATPDTLDFESPIGFPSIRQAQARYTLQFQGGNQLAFAVEDPASVIVEPTGVAGHTEEPMPDVTAHYRWMLGRSHVHFGAFGGMASFRPDAGSADSVALWGLNLSTKLVFAEEDNVVLQLTYGDGVGRYRGGTTAAPDASGDLEAITTTAVMAAIEHHWSDKWRSTLTYSWAQGDLPAGTPATTPEKLSYAAGNLIWQFSERAWTGVELLHGTNDTNDGNEGSADRIQFSIKYSL